MAIMSAVTYRKRLTLCAQTTNGPTRRVPCISGEGKGRKRERIKRE